MAPEQRRPVHEPRLVTNGNGRIRHQPPVPPDSWWTGLTVLALSAVLAGAAVASLGGFLAEAIGTVAAIVYVIVLSFAGPAVLRRWMTVPVWRWCARGAALGGIIGILALPLILAA